MRRQARRVAVVVLIALVTAGILVQPASPQRADSEAPGQWIRPAGDCVSTRFSGLDQISTANVGQLKVAWTCDTGVHRGQEAAPLIVGRTMHLVTPFPNVLYALDIAQRGSVKWKYEHVPCPRPWASPAATS